MTYKEDLGCLLFGTSLKVSLAMNSATHTRRQATVVGAGPVGCVLSILLARRGWDIDLIEKRPDIRQKNINAGRSINLVLTRRGLHALELVGLQERVLKCTVPVLGRMIHTMDGALTYQPYGKNDSECNYSVSRTELNSVLLDAAQEHGVRIRFAHELIHCNVDQGLLTIKDLSKDAEYTHHTPLVFGADGAPSRVRRALMESSQNAIEHVEMLPDGYKELRFAPGEENDYVMAGHALHIWPRGEHMLMGLANQDKSFTGTLYMIHEGEDPSFAMLQNMKDVRRLFRTYYSDAMPWIKDLEEDFFEHPTGSLGTVRCAPWHFKDRVLLIGDAAHGIVPFFGQGLNCGFEDCALLDEMLKEHGAEHGALKDLFERFFQSRKPNTEAIADMALENYVEMRDRVGDAQFLRRKKIERRLEQELPGLYRSRYATVMYSTNSYKDAFDAGVIQQHILDILVQETADPKTLDIRRARALIEEKLTPFYCMRRMNLSF